jgi:hypothetical protein
VEELNFMRSFILDLQKQLNTPVRLRLGAIALATTTLFLGACNRSEPTNVSTQGREPTTSEQVAQNTEQLVGETVTVRGAFEQQIDRISFLIDEGMTAGGEPILVMNISGQPFSLPPEAEDLDVRVTGEIRNFKRMDFENEFGLDLLPGTYDTYEAKPTILANSIELIAQPGDVSENPASFYNQPLNIEGEVEQILSPNTFTLDEEELAGASDLLVVSVLPDRPYTEDQQVMVKGELRNFIVSELEQEYDLTWDLQVKEQLEAEYSNKPVFIATEVMPAVQ